MPLRLADGLAGALPGSRLITDPDVLAGVALAALQDPVRALGGGRRPADARLQ